MIDGAYLFIADRHEPMASLQLVSISSILPTRYEYKRRRRAAMLWVKQRRARRDAAVSARSDWLEISHHACVASRAAGHKCHREGTMTVHQLT